MKRKEEDLDLVKQVVFHASWGKKILQRRRSSRAPATAQYLLSCSVLKNPEVALTGVFDLTVGRWRQKQPLGGR